LPATLGLAAIDKRILAKCYTISLPAPSAESALQDSATPVARTPLTTKKASSKSISKPASPTATPATPRPSAPAIERAAAGKSRRREATRQQLGEFSEEARDPVALIEASNRHRLQRLVPIR